MFYTLISVPHIDLGDGYTRIHTLKDCQAVLNILAFYVLSVFQISIKKNKDNKNI